MTFNTKIVYESKQLSYWTTEFKYARIVGHYGGFPYGDLAARILINLLDIFNT